MIPIPISTIQAIIFALLYGLVENRFMFEASGDKHAKWIFNHFKTYHFLMMLMFATVAFDKNLMFWLWNLIAMPFIQDLTWQTIERRELKQEDWSNLGGFPLIRGYYLWYWACLFILIILGIAIMVI